MVMMGLHFTGEVPFAAVHLTGLVRDALGVKMSKTKGNVLDPTDLVAEYGADAVRFTLASLDSPGRDIPLRAEQMAGYRAFGNKIWNATRFALSRVGDARVRTDLDPAGLALEERWILSKLSRAAGDVEQHLESFRFDLACFTLYSFFWSDFCDWYIELAKPALLGSGDDAAAQRTQLGDVLLTVLDHSLRLLHPVMPFLTEELWQRLPGREAVHPETIALAPYPEPEAAWIDSAAEEAIDGLIRLIVRVRNARADKKVQPRQRVVLYLDRIPALVSSLGEHLRTLAGVERTELEKPPGLAWSGLIEKDGVKFAILPVAAEAEAAPAPTPDDGRRRSELAKLEELIGRAEADLEAPGFLAKAPAQVVEQRRRRLAEMRERRTLLAQALGEGSR
jgi:valyl-tRNA synthetase